VAAKRCPKCGLVNPGTAERCDCGRSFVDGTQGPSLGARIAAKSGGTPEQLREQRDVAIRRARNWILGIGIMMFVVDQFFIHVVYAGYHIPAEWKIKVFLIDAVVLGFFIAMYQVAKTKPLAACVGALVGFWALHLILALFNPASLFQGIPIKVLFTLALIRGIQQARSAQKMIDELAEVFS
jgi:hypothetical protein